MYNLRLIGIKLFTAFNPVCMGSCTDLCAIISRALTYTRLHSAALKTSFPSIGTLKASTTPPNNQGHVRRGDLFNNSTNES
jgi:tetrahydromethanopterin S-methyltransferase subunit C